jgi:hypothetical protein
VAHLLQRVHDRYGHGLQRRGSDCTSMKIDHSRASGSIVPEVDHSTIAASHSSAVRRPRRAPCRAPCRASRARPSWACA